MKITVIGMGPGAPEYLTLQAADRLLEGAAIILRTAKHGVADWLKRQEVSFTTLDDLYESAEDFDELDELAAERLIELARKASGRGEELIYGVPGHGLLEDTTVQALRDAGMELTVLPGLPAALTALSECVNEENLPDMTRGFMMIPASTCDELRDDPGVPVAVTQLDDPMQAGEAELTLSEIWGDEAPGVLVSREKAESIPLYEIDRDRELDHNTTFILSQKGDDARLGLSDLWDILKRLRATDGSEWCSVQTHETLLRYTVEEAYEVADAIRRKDEGALVNELGDLLLHVVFHAQIAEDDERFNFRDISDEAARKMIRRYPELFADGEALSWEEKKRLENGGADITGTIDSLAQSLPGLTLAEKVQEKAAAVGFDWSRPQEALDKVLEEAREVREVLDAGQTKHDEIVKEVGDLIFAAVNTARLAGVDPEEAVRATCTKFRNRFAHVEKRVRESKKEFSEFSLNELDAFWNEAKRLGL